MLFRVSVQRVQNLSTNRSFYNSQSIVSMPKGANATTDSYADRAQLQYPYISWKDVGSVACDKLGKKKVFQLNPYEKYLIKHYFPALAVMDAGDEREMQLLAQQASEKPSKGKAASRSAPAPAPSAS